MKRLSVPLLAALLLTGLLALTAAPAGADPRWVFYSHDTRSYTSPWFTGAHRIMIGFGCTRAPYYAPDIRCAKQHGFHHGIDVAMPCGTRLYSDRRARVVSNDSLGPAYGTNPLLLRSSRLGWDLVIGHTRRVFVHPGDRVRPGTPIARASDNGAPDGCHLHFEARPRAGGYQSAVAPYRFLRLEREG